MAKLLGREKSTFFQARCLGLQQQKQPYLLLICQFPDKVQKILLSSHCCVTSSLVTILPWLYASREKSFSQLLCPCVNPVGKSYLGIVFLHKLSYRSSFFFLHLWNGNSQEGLELGFFLLLISSQRYPLPDAWDVNTFRDQDNCHEDDYYMSVFIKQYLKPEKQTCSDKKCHKATKFSVLGMTCFWTFPSACDIYVN